MDDVSVNLLSLRIFMSCVGLVGNVFLIVSIVQTKLSRVKSFEMFLLALAIANLEEILIVNMYDIIILQASSTATSSWLCHSLKFLTVFGEITCILFTVLISVFRYQKLRDARKRVNLPVCLDSLRSAGVASGVCVMLSLLLSLPIFAMNLQGPAENVTTARGSCPPDFFQCDRNHCPVYNRLYKYLFVLTCNLLPVVIVTVTGCLIVSVLLRSQRKAVLPVVTVSSLGRTGRKGKGPRFQRSTVAVLAAMALFQVDWTLYLIFQLSSSPSDFPFWAEMEFFISTSYASTSPYVYGIGNNLFSLKAFFKR